VIANLAGDCIEHGTDTEQLKTHQQASEQNSQDEK
jgi:hypothetical protein